MILKNKKRFVYYRAAFSLLVPCHIERQKYPRGACGLLCLGFRVNPGNCWCKVCGSDSTQPGNDAGKGQLMGGFVLPLRDPLNLITTERSS